jgi:hypothetical protein
MKKSLLLIAVLALAACTVPAPQRPMPKFAYKQYPPTYLSVANIQVVESYAMPAADPHVEHLMPLPLPTAIADWARSRFKAGGADGTLIITVKNAEVKKTDLPRTRGVKGAFTVDQSERYDAAVEVDFRVDGMMFGQTGQGTVKVARGKTLPENASIQDRDRAWTEMSETLMTDLDANAQTMLQERLPFLLAR